MFLRNQGLGTSRPHSWFEGTSHATGLAALTSMYTPYRQSNSISSRLPSGLPAAATLTLLVGVSVSYVTSSGAGAVVIFFVVTLFGLYLCHQTYHRLGDPNLKVLAYLWIVKILCSLVVMYFGWIPDLDYFTIYGEGSDPQRYYWQAQELIQNNWSPSVLSINYVGILYYYAINFAVFGHNPVTPFVLNAIVTLGATLYLIIVSYEARSDHSPRDWWLAFALLIPEVLWFDIVTARETLVASIMIIGPLTVSRSFRGVGNVTSGKMLAIVAPCAILLGFVRMPMLVPFFLSIALIAILAKPRRIGAWIVRFLAAGLVVGGLALVSSKTGSAGSTVLDLADSLDRVWNAELNTATRGDRNWTEGSVGKLLLPDNPVEAIVYTPFRMIMYLVAPIPNLYITIDKLILGDFVAWQQLFQATTSILNLVVFPFAVAGLIKAVRSRHQNCGPLMIHVVFWVTFIAIAGGNLIIHPRYRVMATLLLAASAWISIRGTSKRFINEVWLVWSFLLVCGWFFYFSRNIF